MESAASGDGETFNESAASGGVESAFSCDVVNAASCNMVNAANGNVESAASSDMVSAANLLSQNLLPYRCIVRSTDYGCLGTSGFVLVGRSRAAR